MAEVARSQIEDAIKAYIDPYLEGDLVTNKAIKDIKIDGDKVSVDIEMGFPVNGYKADLTAKLKEKVEAVLK